MNRLSKTILDEYRGRSSEVNYRDIMFMVKEMKIHLKTPDIVDLTAQYLHEKDFKVWR